MGKADKAGKSDKKKAIKNATTTATPAATPTIGWKIEQPEYDARVANARAEMEKRGLDALVLFHPLRMAYVSGFFHISTERPMSIVVTHTGGLGALVPQLGAGAHPEVARCGPGQKSTPSTRPAARSTPSSTWPTS